MIEEFVDFRWEAILSDKKIQEILNNPSRYQVTTESFKKFLDYAWMVCASEDELVFESLRGLRIKIKEEMEIYDLIAKFQKKYGYIPDGLVKQGLKDFEMPEVEKGKGFTEENILNATDRQKECSDDHNPKFLGDCARLITQHAKDILGGPRYKLVAIALTAAFSHYGIEVTEDQVKDFNRTRRK